MPNMTGRPGYRTMEMNGGSSASSLVPLASTLFSRGGNRRAFRLPGDHFHSTVEPSPGHIGGQLRGISLKEIRAAPKKVNS